MVGDDLTGMRLDAGKVVEARAKEVTYLRVKKVYTEYGIYRLEPP